MTSPTYAAKVTYSYCLVLGREPDGRGLQDWIDALKNGKTTAEMLVDMTNSDEFKSKYAPFGLTDPEYVAMLHRLLLDRDPADAVLSGHVSSVGGKPVRRPDVVKQIVLSAEFSTKHRILFQ